MIRNKTGFSSKGFTLVELLVVVAIIAILAVAAFIAINPITQLYKARDAQRKQDFSQIRSALDAYYNDNNCYPSSIPFGSEWKVGSVIYMKKVPQDPNATCTNGSCYYYYYQTDGSSCPQWTVLYAKLDITPVSAEICGNKIIRTMCPGAPFSVRYNYCLPIGQISCGGLAGATLPNPTIIPTPTPTPLPTPTPSVIPTPTPTPLPTPTPTGACSCATAGYDIRGTCNSVTSSPKYCDVNCTIPCIP